MHIRKYEEFLMIDFYFVPIIFFASRNKKKETENLMLLRYLTSNGMVERYDKEIPIQQQKIQELRLNVFSQHFQTRVPKTENSIRQKKMKEKKNLVFSPLYAVLFILLVTSFENSWKWRKNGENECSLFTSIVQVLQK